ncbi:MAG: MFS transporter [Clostridia bacterium]|nr:MFS transporter [Clostridia bacterium]
MSKNENIDNSIQTTAETSISRRMWAILIVFGLFGQIAWAVENMYFNLFVYDTISPTTSAINIMVTASGIVATIATLFAGALSDKLGNRRKFISFGYIIWGMIVACFAFISNDNTAKIFGLTDLNIIVAATIAIVVVMDCIMTFFGSTANDAAFNAWVTDNTDKTNRGRVEGVLSTLPLISLLIVAGGFGFIVDSLGYPYLFGILGAIISVCGVFGIFFVKDAPKLEREEGSYFKNIFYGFRPSIIKQNKMLYVILSAMCIYSIACNVFMPFFIVYMEQYLGFTTLEYSAVLGGVILSAAVCTIFLGKLSDKVGKIKMLYIVAAVFIVGLFVLFLISDLPKNALLAFTAIVGFVMILGYIMLMVLLNALVRDHTPEREAGKLQGIRMIFYVLIPMVVGPNIGEAINKAAAVSNPARFTYQAELTEGVFQTANVPTPTLFLVAACIAVLMIVPLIYITKNLNKQEKVL